MMPKSCTRTTISSGSGKYKAGDAEELAALELDDMAEAVEARIRVVECQNGAGTVYFGRKKFSPGPRNHYKYPAGTVCVDEIEYKKLKQILYLNTPPPVYTVQ